MLEQFAPAAIRVDAKTGFAHPALALGMPALAAAAAIDGTLMPLGDYKGSGLVLLVDVLSSGLTGSNYSYQASSFGSTEGGPTRCGQLIVAFNPQLLGGARFSANLEGMLGAMQQNPTLRLPGDGRLQAWIAHDQTIEV